MDWFDRPAVIINSSGTFEYEKLAGSDQPIALPSYGGSVGAPGGVDAESHIFPALVKRGQYCNGLDRV